MSVRVCVWSHDYWPCGPQSPVRWAVIDYLDQIPAPLSCCPKCSEDASLIQNTSVVFPHSSSWLGQTRAPRHSKTTAAFAVENRVPALRDGQRSVKPFFKMADAANACSACLSQSVPPDVAPIKIDSEEQKRIEVLCMYHYCWSTACKAECSARVRANPRHT